MSALASAQLLTFWGAVCLGMKLAAVYALPAALRDVIVLRYFTGLTLEETARVLGIPRGTVSTRQRRALDLTGEEEVV